MFKYLLDTSNHIHNSIPCHSKGLHEFSVPTQDLVSQIEEGSNWEGLVCTQVDTAAGQAPSTIREEDALSRPDWLGL
jgi:hypothetical protein